MAPGETSPKAEGGHGAIFATTHWSAVLTAGDDTSPRAEAALAELCRTYWFPLYAFVRRDGFDVHEAQDLTQAFFALLLRKKDFAGLRPEKGRFRSFLLVSLKHFLVNELQRLRAAKRGGGQAMIPLDEITAENRYRREPADTLSPDKVFERQWALTLLEQVFARLRQECIEAGRGAQFDELKMFLSGEKSLLTYAEVGARLGLSEGGVKSAVSRMRERYRELVREEIAHTVANATDVEDELRHLFAVLSG